jgi:lambda family phage portal protein
MAGYIDPTPGSARPHLAIAPHLRTADEEVRRSWTPVASHARQLITQSGFVAFGIELACAWTVGGDGLQPNIVPDAEALGWDQKFAENWARFAEQRFREWSNDPRSCDSGGKQRFGALQNAALRSYFGTGDVIASIDVGEKAHTPWKTSVQLIDPARLKTPWMWQQNTRSAVQDGVEYDRRGRPIAYHFRLPPGITGAQTIRIPVFTSAGKQLVLHAFDGEVGAVRGLSPMASALSSVMSAMNVADAATMAAHLASLICGIVTSDLPSGDLARAIADSGSPLVAMQQQHAEWHQQLHDAKQNLALPHGAQIVHLLSGEKLEILAGKQEFQQYEFLIKNGLREAARALGLSYEHLTSDKSEATYSSIKVAISEAFSVIERRRKIICEPLAEWALFSLIEEMIDGKMLMWPGARSSNPLDDFRKKRAFIRVEWRGPAAPSPDELKAAKAASHRLQFGLSSLSQEIGAFAGDFDAVMKQRKRDQEVIESQGIRIPWPVMPARGGSS